MIAITAAVEVGNFSFFLYKALLVEREESLNDDYPKRAAGKSKGFSR